MIIIKLITEFKIFFFLCVYSTFEKRFNSNKGYLLTPKEKNQKQALLKFHTI